MNIIDYIAMDIKNCREKYAVSAGTTQNIDSVFQSIDIIMSCGIPYEFRTTVVKELHTLEDILSIAQEIKGARAYYLQCFKDSGDLIDSNYSAHSEDVMKKMLSVISPFVDTCGLRGI